MKKLIFVTTAIVFGIITGMIIIIITNHTKNKVDLLGYETENIINENNNVRVDLASAHDVKISPNATLIMQKKYKKCVHTIEDVVKVPYDAVNKTKEEFKEIYKDWEIKKFSEKEIIIYKELEEMCNEHYVLRELDGVIAIYTKNEFEEENLVEVTNVLTKYLPDVDLQSLQEGISLYGKEKLTYMLQDFE